jgi:hypothetical protein
VALHIKRASLLTNIDIKRDLSRLSISLSIIRRFESPILSDSDEKKSFKIIFLFLG